MLECMYHTIKEAGKRICACRYSDYGNINYLDKIELNSKEAYIKSHGENYMMQIALKRFDIQRGKFMRMNMSLIRYFLGRRLFKKE